MKTKGFAHLLLINHWYSIVIDQIRIILTSGLYDECEEINIGCLGTELQRSLLEKFVVNVYPKFKIRYYSEKLDEYEFPSIKLIEEDNSRYIGFYFHTKAVTRIDDIAQTNNRAWLNESVLNRWRGHRKRVENGWDVSAQNYLLFPAHLSGNFWWFNREYVNALPKIDTLDKTNRHLAEQWICMSKYRRVYSDVFLEPTTDTFRIEYKKQD